MNKVFCRLALLSLALPSTLALSVSAQARAPEQSSRDIMTTSFEALSVTGPISVEIRTGVSPAIVAHGDPQMVERLLVRKNGDRLRLSLKHTRTDIDPRKQRGGRLYVTLSTWALHQLDISGPADISADLLTGQEIELSLAGPGRLHIDKLLSDTLELSMVGNGSVEIGGGEADIARIDLNGAPSLEAEAFQAERLRLLQTGPASVRMQVRDSAQISTNGAGAVEILGRPTCEIAGTGTAEVSCGAP